MAINKMFIMLPVMLAARRLDGEDEMTIKYVRICYGVIQTLCVLAVLVVYMTANRVQNSDVVFVPPPPQPFADPNAKQKYTQIRYQSQVLSSARSLLGSTLFGIALTLGLHYYKGMIMGLAIQCIMGPINLYENKLALAALTGSGLSPDDKIFDEKAAHELQADDEIVDEQGNPVTKQAVTTPNLSEVLLDVWDGGSKADLSKLDRFDETTIHTRTEPDQWTVCMILAGLKHPDAPTALRVCVEEKGADLSLTDNDGWTPLHWAAFHGNVTTAEYLLSVKNDLRDVKDKEGLTPLETAVKEGNKQVVSVLQESKKSK